MMKLCEMGNLKQEVNATIRCNVLEVGEIESTSMGNKSKFSLTVADATGAASATCYDITKKPKFIPGMGVMLMNALVRQSFISITSRTDVGMAKPLEIPPEIKANAPKLHGQETEGPISHILASPAKSIATVKGKVISVSPATTKRVQEDDVPFQELILKDRSGQGTIAIWEDMVTSIKQGELVKLTKCRVRLFNGEKKLSTTRQSLCERISHDDELHDISDDDTTDDPASENMKNGVILAVCDVDPYLACNKHGCNNTKLVTVLDNEKYLMHCKNCNTRMNASNAGHYLRASLIVEFDDCQKKLAVFKPQIQQLFEAQNYEWDDKSYDRDTLISSIVDILPIQIKCVVVNNTIRSLYCKRK